MHIYISNLNIETTCDDIKILLKDYASRGNCAICRIKDSITRELATFALVDMLDVAEMQHAIKLFNGAKFLGSKLSVQVGR